MTCGINIVPDFEFVRVSHRNYHNIWMCSILYTALKWLTPFITVATIALGRVKTGAIGASHQRTIDLTLGHSRVPYIVGITLADRCVKIGAFRESTWIRTVSPTNAIGSIPFEASIAVTVGSVNIGSIAVVDHSTVNFALLSGSVPQWAIGAVALRCVEVSTHRVYCTRTV